MIRASRTRPGKVARPFFPVRRRGWLLALGLGLSAGAGAQFAGPGKGAAAPGGARPVVTIGLGYIPNVQFTPFYVAETLGYYREAGFDVKFQHGYVTELMPLLLRGKLDFVVGDPEDAVFARQQGAPLKYVMAMYQKSPVTLFSLSPLNDLRGKTLGVPGPFGSSYHALQALLASRKLSAGRDVKLVTIGFTQQEAVRTGRVSAATGYLNNDVVLLGRATGRRVYTLDLSAAYPMVGVGLITQEKTLNTARARAIVRASQRGLSYTLKSPAQAYALARPRFGEAGGDLGILKASLPLMTSAYTRQRGLGALDPAAWRGAVAALVQQGKLPAGTKPETFYSNALIDPALRGP